MTIVSEPPGASVTLNGRLIGAAPVDVPTSLFEYYGDYDVMLLADGYDPLLVRQNVPPPLYGYPFIDFISEVLWPFHVKDKRVFTYQLAPARIVPPDELQKNAEELRSRGQGIGTPTQPVAREQSPARLDPPVVE
jgi:hypothetical protein